MRLSEPFTPLRVPKFFDLRADPYERADVTSNTYYDWMFSQIYLISGAQAAVAKFQDTFREFPPRQKAASFTVSEAISKIESASGSH